MLRAVAWLVTGALAGAVSLGAWTAPEPAAPLSPEAAAQPPAEATFESSIDVSLLTMVVRVVDTWGNPILGLAADDFRVRIGKREVPVAALDWVAAAADVAGPSTADAEVISAPTEAPCAPGDGGTQGGSALCTPGDAFAPPPPPGRLVVVFVQANLLPSRISGQLRLRPFTRELLATLQPADRVAVVSFDSHLKLRQDFAADLDATHAAIDEAMLFSPERAVTAAQPHSLAAHFERAAARQAASAERALELTARAMAPLPGEKLMIYLGWGLGRFDGAGVRMTPAFAPAVRALRAARASVFVLDVTSADGHSLEVGLQDVAEATGGAYFSTFRLPGLATRTLARAISGYYVLTLSDGAVADAEGEVRIELRDGRGTVLTPRFKRVAVDAPLPLRPVPPS